MKKSQKGFTLIELLIVIAIIGILAAILIPNLLTARDKASAAAQKAQLDAAKTEALLLADGNTGSYLTVCTSGNTVSNLILNSLQKVTSSAVVTDISFLQGSGTYTATSATHANCVSTSSGFAAEVPLKNPSGSFYCIDSTGVAKESTTVMIGSNTDVTC